MTFNLLRTAHFLNADSTGWAGYDFPDGLDAASTFGLYADKLKKDRFVIDQSLCFKSFDDIPVWDGMLGLIYLVTPYDTATFNGLQFFVARPLKAEKSEMPPTRSFKIISIQMGLIQTRREIGRAKPPNGTHEFGGRNRYDAQASPQHVPCFS